MLNNPPAFPTYFTGDHALSMTLRDYFAAKAMQACIAKGTPLVFDAIADKAYEMADAMMEARNAAQ